MSFLAVVRTNLRRPDLRWSFSRSRR